MYPIKFEPVFQERVWGGQNLRRVFNRKLPEGQPIGESWEICDRPEAQTRIANGELKGLTLHEAITRLGTELMGIVPLSKGRFPLLIKFLDARERLSLQVHPPVDKAEDLGGEPKTEMWVIAECTPDAHLIAGLRQGVTRTEFEARLKDNSLEPLCHRFPVRPGDVMFLPSGRLHAIDAGNVIVEIQQNSDTTYRVYDWGRPREIHVEQSMRSIDFSDFEPPLTARIDPAAPETRLVECPYFRVSHETASSGFTYNRPDTHFEIWICMNGQGSLNGEPFSKGDVVLIPAALTRLEVAVDAAPLRWLVSKA